MPDALRDYAVDNLRYIRDAMERASAFTSIPGWGGFAIGLSALATAAIAEPMTVWNPRRWLSVWLIEAAVAAVIGAVSMWQKARRFPEKATRYGRRHPCRGGRCPVARF